MILREFIERCETGYNSITIISKSSNNGYYFKDMKDIPEDMQKMQIVRFDSGFGYDAENGLILGLSVVLRRLPEERR